VAGILDLIPRISVGNQNSDKISTVGRKWWKVRLKLVAAEQSALYNTG
jgi:hypothetical protein